MTPLPHASDFRYTVASDSCRNWPQVLRDYRGIERALRRRAAFVSLVSLATAPLRLYERRRHHDAVRRPALETPPVFVIGHWRSGTTHLHTLLCQDPRSGYVTTYQAIAPVLLFVGERTPKPTSPPSSVIGAAPCTTEDTAPRAAKSATCEGRVEQSVYCWQTCLAAPLRVAACRL
jgi:hypothetical protein